MINPIKKSSSAPSISQVQNNANSRISKVTKEVKVYTEEDHLEAKPDEVKELYESFKTAILNLSPNIEVSATKLYIAFKKGKNITDIRIQKNDLKLWINLRKGELDDPKNLASDVSEVGHWGNGDYELKVSDTTHLEYIMSLVKQVIE